MSLSYRIDIMTPCGMEPVMSLLRPLDPAFPIERQLAVDASPVVLVNIFTLDKADEQAFLETWQDDALFMKRQPGFISTQLHRAIGESFTYLNYAVWESTAAFTHPEFRANWVSPSLPLRDVVRLSGGHHSTAG